MNLPDRVVPATRTKVLAAIEALGYVPNFGARAMAAKRTYTIGAIIPTMENAIFARGLQAFQEELQELGYTLLVSSSSYKPDIEEAQIRALVARGADGLLVIGHDRDPAIYDYLDRQGVPVLVAWTYAPDQPRPSIGFDNFAGMKVLTQAVLARGHRQIGVITAPTEGNDRARARLQAIRAVAGEAGLAEEAVSVVETPYSIAQGALATTRLLQQDLRPTVLMCGNDVLAVGALRGIRDAGLAVPQDISVTGFDDIELCQIVSPPLTTVHVPHREMGRKAAQTLVQMVTEGTAIPSVELQSSLKLRGSLGQAASD